MQFRHTNRVSRCPTSSRSISRSKIERRDTDDVAVVCAVGTCRAITRSPGELHQGVAAMKMKNGFRAWVGAVSLAMAAGCGSSADDSSGGNTCSVLWPCARRIAGAARPRLARGWSYRTSIIVHAERRPPHDYFHPTFQHSIISTRGLSANIMLFARIRARSATRGDARTSSRDVPRVRRARGDRALRAPRRTRDGVPARGSGSPSRGSPKGA
jgi:hypothetical protein